MTHVSRKSASASLRLPLALGVAGLMVTGSAAMAWPVLKTVLVPTEMASTAPDDPAAISGFVETTRQQMTPTVALAAEMPEVTQTRVPSLTVDSAAFRQPRPAPQVEEMTLPPQIVFEFDSSAETTEPAIDVETAQAQTPRPAPRPGEGAQSATPAAVVPQSTPPAGQRVMPATTRPQQGAPATQTRGRLKNPWSSGAFR